MLIVALCGKMGSGKDYVARTYVLPLLRSLGLTCMQMCFADQIKVNAIVRHGLAPQSVLDAKTRDTRSLLQREGTELGRDVHGQDVWIRYFDAWTDVHGSRGVDAIVATDLRFVNEAEHVKRRNGILVRVLAPRRNADRLASENDDGTAATHRSECEMDEFRDVDVVVENDEDIDESNPLHPCRLAAALRRIIVADQRL